ncbi:TPA: glycosyltransferase family 4 protein [Enterobacter hormaechei]
MKTIDNILKAVLVIEAWGKGGTETYVSGLIRELVRNNVDVTLVLLKDAKDAVIDILPREKVVVSSIAGLPNTLRKFKPDVVSLHLYTSLLPVVAIARLLHIPVVNTLHIPFSAWSIRHRLYRRMAARLSSRVVSVSRMILDEYKNINSHPCPLPGGVDMLFFEHQNSVVSDCNDFMIVAMGRLEYEKDWPTLIRAVSLLPVNSRSRILLRFFGSGSQLTELQCLARENDVRTEFNGYVEKGSLASALSKAHLSVLPSRFEGLGLSALEGMAVGVPTITADFPAANDYIEHGVTGHMFPVGDAQALSRLIAWHMDNIAESQKLGEAGRQLVQSQFSEKTTYLPYLDIFKGVYDRCV